MICKESTITVRNQNPEKFLKGVLVSLDPKYSFEMVSGDFLDRAEANNHPLELISFVRGGLQEALEIIEQEKKERGLANIRVLKRFCLDLQTPLLFYNVPGNFPGVLGLYGYSIPQSILPLGSRFVFC